MPEISDSIEQLRSKFAEKGLSEKDLVVGGPDPLLDKGLLKDLANTCPSGGDLKNLRAPLDHEGSLTFDDHILTNIRDGLAVLRTDALLYEDKATRAIIDDLLRKPSMFPQEFATAMVKMGRIGLKSEENSQVRRDCAILNQ